MMPIDTISATYVNGSVLAIDRTDLTNFEYDIGNINTSIQWADLTSSTFQTWMEPNAMLTTTKLIGRFTYTLEGVVNITIGSKNRLIFSEK